MNRPTFFWHDYETWGADPRRDRPSQFAGIRSDLDFNPIGKPLVLYCRPADDMLPHPEACLVTGITPQQARAEGVIEAEFFAALHTELARPGTCGVGYNSIRFDDEFTRYGLYRNFYDPYAREWQNGNSRWDIIDMVRLTRALRPDGIEWPQREDGTPSFRLQELTAANGIAHEAAHDALSDVRATIALAKLVRERQGRLYDFVFSHRDKRGVAQLLDVNNPRMLLHVSGRIPAALGCISPVLPLAPHPRNRNSVIVFDLRHDPEPLFSLDAERVRERLYTASEDLAAGETRIGLKEVHLNRSPVLVPMNTLTDAAAAEWSIDLPEVQRRCEALAAESDLAQKLAAVFGRNPFPPARDPEQALYDGFLDDADRRRCDRVRTSPPEALARLGADFDDPRLPELLFRYRARNWPNTLTREERTRWDELRLRRLTDPQADVGITLEDYRRTLARLAADTTLSPQQRAVVDALLDWPGEIGL